MTLSVWQVLLFFAGIALLVWGLHALAWHLLNALISTMDRLPLLRQTRAWARVRPLQAWLRLRHPRLHAILAARLRPKPFIGLPLTLLVLGAFYVAGLLGGLTGEVLEAGAILRFDQAVNAAFGAWRMRPLFGIFLWITALGAGPALTAVAVVATAFLWADRRPGFILPLWVAFLGAQATTWSGKFVIARHRPDFIHAVFEASPSFPSGHATASMALYGFLAYALVRDLPGRRKRFEVAFWVAVLVLAIGFSRIFLSLHYTTDVAAGFMVGAFWLLVGFAVSEWTRDRRPAPIPLDAQHPATDAGAPRCRNRHLRVRKRRV
jgi:membrane-associated phospholipid phosphatase